MAFFSKITILSDFYRSRLFTCEDKRDIFFNVNAEKEKAKCMQLNDKRISSAQIRMIGKSRLTVRNVANKTYSSVRTAL